MKKITCPLAILFAFFTFTLFLPSAQAGSVNADLHVSVVVDTACIATTTPITFSTYSPLGANATSPDDSTGGIVLTCSAGITNVIGLSAGAHPLGNQNTLSDGSSHALNYDLYQNSSRTIPWRTGSAAFTAPTTVDSNPITYSVYGRIPAGQNVPSGAYSDSVVVTVNF